MKRFCFLTFLCVLPVMVLIAGCSLLKGQDTEPTAVTLGAEAESLYSQAIDTLRAETHLSYDIITTQNTNYEDQEFSRVTQQHLDIENRGKDAMRSAMVETQRFDDFSVDITEHFEDGNGYVTVNGSCFTAPVSAKDFGKRYAPLILLAPTLYSDIHGIIENQLTTIYFQKPNSPEGWALPDGAVFTDASGYVILDQNGALSECSYTISYNIGSLSVVCTTQTNVTQLTAVAAPEQTEQYIPIDCIDAPIMLEQACGYLLQADNVHSIAKTDINCETFSINRSQISDLTLSGIGDAFYAQFDIRIDQLNQSRGGEITKSHQVETFKDNKYSICVDGAAPAENKSIDAAAMRKYCQDMLVQDILLPNHISGVTMEETDTAITLTFQATDALAEAICSNLCQTLYSDAELLHTVSSEYKTQFLQCILTIDKHTGLPLSYLSEYSAYHTIEEISYLLESKTTQEYQYTEISGQ